jgi:hypothetical protein
LSADQSAELVGKCWKAFLEIGQDQAKIVEEEKPTRRFLGVLYTIVAQGRAILLPKDESPTEPKPGVDFVGWRDDDFLYLLPEATFAAVVRLCRDTGEHFPTRQERLKKDLAKEGISECEHGRFTTNLWVSDRTRRVLKLSMPKIKDLIAEDLPTLPTHSHSSHFYEGRRDGL